MSFGVDYEFFINKKNKWSIVVPLAYAWVHNTKSESVKEYQEKNIYTTPGLKYYFKEVTQSGFAISLHSLYSEKMYIRNNDFFYKRMYVKEWGGLLNVHYQTKISNKLFLNVEAGTGYRFSAGSGIKQYFGNYQVGPQSYKEQYNNTIYNFSLGLKYTF